MSSSVAPEEFYLTKVTLTVLPPLSDEHANRAIRLVEHDADELTDKVCAICITNFEESRGTAVQHTACRNYFHFNCVEEWAQRSAVREEEINFAIFRTVLQFPKQSTCSNCRGELDKRPFDKGNFGRVNITKNDWRITETVTKYIQEENFLALNSFLSHNLPEQQQLHRSLPYSAFKLPLIAASSDSPEALEKLKENNFKLDAVNRSLGFRQTPLFVATVNKAHRSMLFLLNEAKVTQAGNSVGAAPDATVEGRPLNAAAYLADDKAAELLLDFHANPLLEDTLRD